MAANPSRCKGLSAAAASIQQRLCGVCPKPLSLLTRMIVEPTPVDVSPATGPAYRGSRPVPATLLRTPAPPAPALLAPGPAHATMDLQRRAPRNLRRHLERATVR